jgi:hypothetical protein
LRKPSRIYYELEFDWDNKEVGERSVVVFDLSDDDKTAAFETFIGEISRQIRDVRAVGSEWGFADLALRYLTKGFLSDGLEQMLWHMVAN